MSGSIKSRIKSNLRSVIEKTFPLITYTYRFYRDARFVARNPVMTPLGFFFAGDASMENGSFETEEVSLVRRILKNVDIFINIGANYGYYCCISLREGLHTVAFEPLEHNVRCLYKNVKVNGWENNIEIYPIALGNKSGFTEIFGSGSGASLVKGWAEQTSSHSTLVPIFSLDKILGKNYAGQNCFVLVDIEGAEFLMLQGAKSFLAQEPKPIWMVEICVSQNQPQDIAINPNLLPTFEMFWDNGYESFTADRNLTKVIRKDVEHASSEGLDKLFTYNFLFIENRRAKQLLIH